MVWGGDWHRHTRVGVIMATSCKWRGIICSFPPLWSSWKQWVTVGGALTFRDVIPTSNSPRRGIHIPARVLDYSSLPEFSSWEKLSRLTGSEERAVLAAVWNAQVSTPEQSGVFPRCGRVLSNWFGEAGLGSCLNTREESRGGNLAAEIMSWRHRGRLQVESDPPCCTGESRGCTVCCFYEDCATRHEETFMLSHCSRFL